MDVIQTPTCEQILNSIKGEARCCVGPNDPEIMRKLILDGGGSAELADQVARAIEEENRKNGYVLDKAS